MGRLLLLLQGRAEAGLEQGEVISVGWDLRARERMDMDLGVVEVVLEVGDLDLLLELEYQVVNGEEGSGYRKDQRVEVVVIQEVSGEVAEEGTNACDTSAVLDRGILWRSLPDMK
jgi:hypothetical protein